MSDEKKSIKANRVAQLRHGLLKYKEFAPRNILPAVTRDPAIMAYLPDEAAEEKSTFSDRVFLWSILMEVKPEWTEKFYNEVLDFHLKKKEVVPVKKPQIEISAHWLEELKRFEFSVPGKC